MSRQTAVAIAIFSAVFFLYGLMLGSRERRPSVDELAAHLWKHPCVCRPSSWSEP